MTSRKKQGKFLRTNGCKSRIDNHEAWWW